MIATTNMSASRFVLILIGGALLGGCGATTATSGPAQAVVTQPNGTAYARSGDATATGPAPTVTVAPRVIIRP